MSASTKIQIYLFIVKAMHDLHVVTTMYHMYDDTGFGIFIVQLQTLYDIVTERKKPTLMEYWTR